MVRMAVLKLNQCALVRATDVSLLLSMFYSLEWVSGRGNAKCRLYAVRGLNMAQTAVAERTVVTQSLCTSLHSSKNMEWVSWFSFQQNISKSDSIGLRVNA